MNRREAIAAIKEVQSGNGVNVDIIPDLLKGDLARDNWRDPKFSYGVEYGFIIGLMRAFDITAEELT